ncbi:MAG TPA: ribosome small subunit-dependent GTPase A [Candidatus Limnocylindria bacterium]|nr:ribosome small subunit-dependent GTPase A [Candidatus Limnocylindria bacterium]
MSADGLRRARVIAVGRNAAWIVAEDEAEPRLASLRKLSRHAMLVPGDLVAAAVIADDRVVIDTLHERGFVLARRTAGGRTKTMAANIDTIAIVAALVDPPLHLTMIDQLVAFAVQHEVEALLLLTKVDLAGEEAAERTAAIYRALGVPVLILQPKSGRGIDGLREALGPRRALLVGNSGVGKSTIFRALGGIGIEGALSRFGRGRQTTTSARLFRLGEGFLIDSPGIGEFALDPMPATELGYLFVELREPATRCRFADCRHLSEPECAVRAAVDAGRIAPSRYASYREILTADPAVSGRLGRRPNATDSP